MGWVMCNHFSFSTCLKVPMYNLLKVFNAATGLDLVVGEAGQVTKYLYLWVTFFSIHMNEFQPKQLFLINIPVMGNL